MPPKKVASKGQPKNSRSGKTNGKADSHESENKPSSEEQELPEASPSKSKQNASDKKTNDATTPASQGRKRKQPTDENSTPQKEPRRSGRGGGKSAPSEKDLLNYLLSPSAEALCRPEDETEDIKSRGDIRTYSSSVLNPFEELLCAVILSRPISHRLGLRSIRTILNDPYNFTSAKAIQKAGGEQHHQALWDARTQHKGKTAEQIGQLADVVLEKFTAKDDKEGTRLQKALDDADGDIDVALDAIKDSIKGLGATGLNIFLRRVQWIWTNGFPYVDSRTALSLRKLGLPDEAEDVRDLVEKVWGELETQGVAGKNEEEKKRRAFVVVLERVVGADLEGKIDDLVKAAAGGS